MLHLTRCVCVCVCVCVSGQNTAYNSQREFQDQGIICVRNLKQTMKVGGRKILPAPGEVAAVLSGKYTKIQKLYLPGDRTKSIKIHAVTVRVLHTLFIPLSRRGQLFVY